jgi:hypothetical protein
MATMALAGACFFTVHPAANASTPPDPERPFTARTCEDAMKRVEEARLGNPMVDAATNRRHAELSIAEANRLCSREIPRRRED